MKVVDFEQDRVEHLHLVRDRVQSLDQVSQDDIVGDLQVSHVDVVESDRQGAVPGREGKPLLCVRSNGGQAAPDLRHRDLVRIPSEPEYPFDVRHRDLHPHDDRVVVDAEKHVALAQLVGGSGRERRVSFGG